MELNRYCEAGEIRGLTPEERHDIKIMLHLFEKYQNAQDPFWIHFRGHRRTGEFSLDVEMPELIYYQARVELFDSWQI